MKITKAKLTELAERKRDNISREMEQIKLRAQQIIEIVNGKDIAEQCYLSEIFSLGQLIMTEARDAQFAAIERETLLNVANNLEEQE